MCTHKLTQGNLCETDDCLGTIGFCRFVRGQHMLSHVCILCSQHPSGGIAPLGCNKVATQRLFAITTQWFVMPRCWSQVSCYGAMCCASTSNMSLCDCYLANMLQSPSFACTGGCQWGSISRPTAFVMLQRTVVYVCR